MFQVDCRSIKSFTANARAFLPPDSPRGRDYRNFITERHSGRQSLGPKYHTDVCIYRRLDTVVFSTMFFMFKKGKYMVNRFLMTKMAVLSQVCGCGRVSQSVEGRVGHPVGGVLWNPGIRSPPSWTGLFLSVPVLCASVPVGGAPGPLVGHGHCIRYPQRSRRVQGEQRGHSCSWDGGKCVGRIEDPGSWSNGRYL